jgi:hypothetical protein
VQKKKKKKKEIVIIIDTASPLHLKFMCKKERVWWIIPNTGTLV